MEKLNEEVIFKERKDYKQRFIAEYWQTKNNYEKLKNLNNRIEAAQLSHDDMPEHESPTYVLLDQQKKMADYLHVLEVRAIIENIDLNGEPQYQNCSLGDTERE